MSEEKQPSPLDLRRQRIKELVEEARRLLKENPKRYIVEKEGDYEFPNYNLSDDLTGFAQRTWYLSRSTARDYAQVVIGELDAKR